MKELRKLIALLLICASMISLVACGKSSTNTGNEPGGETSTAPSDSGSTDSGGNASGGGSVKDTLSIALASDRSTLDPRNLVGAETMYIINYMVYETLWIFNTSNELIPVLAESVDFVEPLRWRIKVRDDVTFANGSKFTASDVLFSLHLWQNRTGEAPAVRGYNEELSSVISEYECELIFDEHNLGFQYSVGNVSIFDEETFNQDNVTFETNGTGPYVITEYTANSHLFLELRDDYWGEMPSMKKIECRILSEDTQITNALQTGTVDIATVPTQDVDFVKTLSDFNVKDIPAQFSRGLIFNVTENSIFYDNTDARMAVAIAIDRPSIIRIAYNNHASVPRAPGSVGLSDMEERFMDMGAYGIGYNPELAEEYAEKAGIIGKTVRLVCDTSTEFTTVAEIIQQNLRDIGVDCEIKQVDQASWLAVFFDPWEAGYDMALDGFIGSPSGTLAQAYWGENIDLINAMFMKEDNWPGHARTMEILDFIMSIPLAADRSDLVYELTELNTAAVTWLCIADPMTYTAYNKDLMNFDGSQRLGGSVYYSKLHWG